MYFLFIRRTAVLPMSNNSKMTYNVLVLYTIQVSYLSKIIFNEGRKPGSFATCLVGQIQSLFEIVRRMINLDAENNTHTLSENHNRIFLDLWYDQSFSFNLPAFHHFQSISRTPTPRFQGD